jgi:hypothetical protein
MKPTDLRRAVLVIAVLAVAMGAAGLAVWWRSSAGTPRGTLTVGASLVLRTTVPLKIEEPFRAVLALDAPLRKDRYVDLEVHRIEPGRAPQLAKCWTVRAAARADELYAGFASTAAVVHSPGAYRMRALIDGEVIAEHEFQVAGAHASSAAPAVGAP